MNTFYSTYICYGRFVDINNAKIIAKMPISGIDPHISKYEWDNNLINEEKRDLLLLKFKYFGNIMTYYDNDKLSTHYDIFIAKCPAPKFGRFGCLIEYNYLLVRDNIMIDN